MLASLILSQLRAKYRWFWQADRKPGRAGDTGMGAEPKRNALKKQNTT